MDTLRLKRIIGAFIVLIIFSASQFSSVIAADDPLLLLNYKDIDSSHFMVNCTLSNTPAFAAFELPVAFDTEYVRICGYSSETGEFFTVEDGDKEAEQIEDGKSGIILSSSISDEDKWNGNVLDNDMYPYISNSEGIIKIVMYTFSARPLFEESNELCSICFERIKEGNAKIRIATEANCENYDEAAPDGALFSIDGMLLPVAWQYDGDVFEDNEDIVLPSFVTDSEDGDASDVTDDKSDSDTSANSGNGEKNSEDNKNDISGTDDTSKDDDSTESIFFYDVDASHWAGKYIYALAEQSIINGYGDSMFRPQSQITRAELVTMASKAMDFDYDDNEVVFTDSNADVWYNRYLTAAYKNNIINGYPGGEFRPQNNISREDLCVIMYRMFFADGNDDEYELSYADADEISDYAKEAVRVMSKKGVLKGRDNNMFAPKDFATRAEVAKVLYVCMYETL